MKNYILKHYDVFGKYWYLFFAVLMLFPAAFNTDYPTTGGLVLKVFFFLLGGFILAISTSSLALHLEGKEDKTFSRKSVEDRLTMGGIFGIILPVFAGFSIFFFVEINTFLAEWITLYVIYSIFMLILSWFLWINPICTGFELNEAILRKQLQEKEKECAKEEEKKYFSAMLFFLEVYRKDGLTLTNEEYFEKKDLIELLESYCYLTSKNLEENKGFEIEFDEEGIRELVVAIGNDEHICEFLDSESTEKEKVEECIEIFFY